MDNNAVYYVTRVALPVALALLLAGIGLLQRRKILKVITSLKYNQELVLYKEFSTKSDVYSFGVMLLEILSGKINFLGDGTTNIINDAWKLWREEKLEKLIDPTLKKESTKVIRCIKIALLCLQEQPSTRPTMQDVLIYLNKDSVDFPPPVIPIIYSYDITSATSIIDTSRRMNSQSGDQAYEEDDLYPHF
ncbi:hypothetical protein V2J09_005086 [Rumex salicifolius]